VSNKTNRYDSISAIVYCTNEYTSFQLDDWWITGIGSQELVCHPNQNINGCC